PRFWKQTGSPMLCTSGYLVRKLHTSIGVGNKLFSRRTKLLINANQKQQQETTGTQDPVVPTNKENLSIRERKGGYDLGAGMHLCVPIEARNVEKAWEIWSAQVRYTDISHPAQFKLLTQLVRLFVGAANSTDSTDIFGSREISAKDTAKQNALAGFRVAAVLRDTFKNAADTIAATTATGDAVVSLEDVAKQRILRFGHIRDYNNVLALLGKVLFQKGMETGNSPTSIGKSARDLEADLDKASVSRIAYLLLLSATKESIQVTEDAIKLALEAAILCRDVTAARDSLLLFNPDLALLLDPQAPVDGKAYSSKGIAGVSEKIVDMLLRLVAVGRNPHEIGKAAREEQQQQQLTDMEGSLCDIDRFVNTSKADSESNSAENAVWSWRVETMERIYKAYVSTGITEVPSPDQSSRPSLQGSVIPSPPMLATMLTAFSGAKNIDQAIIVYDTLVATLKQTPYLGESANNKPELQEGSRKATLACKEIKAEHKMSNADWVRVFISIRNTKQDWLVARVLEDLCGDGWAPSAAMYERYLDLLPDASKESLKSMVGRIRDIVQFSEKPELFVETLVNALSQPTIALPEDVMGLRIEQALLISGLPLPQTEPGAAFGQDKALVSDDTARALVNALVSHKQIDRARRLAEIWNEGRPELINNNSISRLILELSSKKRYVEALELFSGIQQTASDEVTVDILGSVLQAYMLAGDFEEAVSVAKRIRAIVKQDRRTVKIFDAAHIVYSSMIQAYCETDQVTEALRVLEEMRANRVSANSDTYTILVQTMSRIRSYDGLKLVVGLVNVDYNMANRTGYASTFASSKPLPLSTDYYNALIEAYGRVAEPAKALQVWEIMRQRGVKANDVTASLLIDTCGWNERVHWDQDLLPTANFVYRDVPDDHVYTGMPFMHMHYLASCLEQLQQAGHKLSVANHRHLLEALIRGGFLEDAFDMVLGRFESEGVRGSWAKKAQILLNPSRETVLSRMFSLFKLEKDGHETGDDRVTEGKTSATFMDDFSIDVPLCQETVDTLFGMVSAVRGQCVQGKDVDPIDMPFVQRASHNLLQRLDLHEQRLTEFLTKERPDLLPRSS
ncbi:hypothetical protein LPJ57_005731, partial [Coemansia sp. RSA 486]